MLWKNHRGEYHGLWNPMFQWSRTQKQSCSTIFGDLSDKKEQNYCTTMPPTTMSDRHARKLPQLMVMNTAERSRRTKVVFAIARLEDGNTWDFFAVCCVYYLYELLFLLSGCITYKSVRWAVNVGCLEDKVQVTGQLRFDLSIPSCFPKLLEHSGPRHMQSFNMPWSPSFYPTLLISLPFNACPLKQICSLSFACRPTDGICVTIWTRAKLQRAFLAQTDLIKTSLS